MKKVALFIILFVLPLIAFADASGITGSCTWSYNEETGTLTISGNGSMANYTYDVTDNGWGITNIPWYKYSNKITNVVISSGVTSIGGGAFSGFKALTSISIPTTVKSIGHLAFEDCSQLESIVIPSSVKTIGHYAFENCSSLTSVSIESNITYLAYWVFGYCTNLRSITLPESLTAIKKNAFYGSGIESVVIPDNVKTIEDYAFANCENMESVTIGKRVSSIGYYAFSDCKNLNAVNISDLMAWCSMSFKDNPLIYAKHLYVNGEELHHLSIPYGITSISSSAFQCCESLESVTMPETLKSIGFGAFWQCSNLKDLFIDNNLTTIESHAFAECVELSSLTLPCSVTSVGDAAFSGCRKLKTLTIPNQVESIGSSVFYSCSCLESISIGTNAKTIGRNAFADCNNIVSVSIDQIEPATISFMTFSNAANAVLYVPKGSKDIYESADYWKDFKEIREIPVTIAFADSEVKRICVERWDTNGDGELDEAEAAAVTELRCFFSEKAITSFDELKYFTGLTHIGEGEFFCCGDLKSVTLPASLTKIDERGFSCCSSLESIVVPNSVTTIEMQAFEGCSKLKSIMLPNGITRIGGGAFMDCRSLEEITLPESLTAMSEAFVFCSSLKSIYIPKNVRYASAFRECTSLQSIIVDSDNPYLDSRNNFNAIIETATNRLVAGCVNTVIPDDVVAIGSMAFAGMDKIEEINVPDGVYEIGFDAFCGTQWFNNQPDGLVYAGNVAYRYKGSIDEETEIVLREGTKGIGEYAFEDDNCQGPASITIPESVVYIAPYAFWQCWGLKSLFLKMSEPVNVVDCLSDKPENTTLYVPKGSKEAYMKIKAWSMFKEIVEMEEESSRNALYATDAETLAGKTMVLPINMINDDEVKLCQFDLRLPTGVTVATKINGKLDTRLTERAESHSVTGRQLDNGDYRFVISSMDNDSFVGNEGTLMEITLEVSATMEAGEYAVKVLNVEVSVPDGNDLIVVRPKDTESKLTVKSYTPGDVNSDGAVSVTDVGCAINYILEQVPSVFIFEAADMNGDKSVSVTDVGMIINCILSDGAASRRMGQSVQSTAEASNALKVQSLKVTPGGSVELSIELENASTNLMGWQCDIVLPEGLTLALKDNGKPAAKLGDRFSTTGHAISSSRLANGAYRFIATSMDGEAIPCNGGTLFTVTLQADAALTAGTRLTGTVANIEFNTQDNQKLTLNDVAVAVDITGGTTTGVASVRAVLVQSRDGQVIVSGIDDDTMVAVYDLAGRQVGHAVGSGGTATVSTTLCDGDKAIVKVGQRTVKLIVKP